MANNIGRVREVPVRAARPGWRGGRPAAAVTKVIWAEAEGLQPRTLCYTLGQILSLHLITISNIDLSRHKPAFFPKIALLDSTTGKVVIFPKMGFNVDMSPNTIHR